MNNRLLLAAVAAVAILGSNAQIVSPSADGYIYRAADMIAEGNYVGAIDQLTGLDETNLTPYEREIMHYYRAVATVHTNKPLAITLLQQFLGDYPQSMLRNDALFALGDCYYGSNYTEAVKIYNTVSPKALSTNEADALVYRKAYCYLEKNNYGKALPLFESLVASDKYNNAALFYCGYIYYTRREYSQAEMLLKEVDPLSNEGYMAEYYLCQIYFMRDDYRKTLSLARNLLRRDLANTEFVAEANRLAGESSYLLGEDAQAVKYLTTYVSMVKKPLPSAVYILGLNAYSKGLYNDAINYLSPVSECDDAMGQSAYLYLGQAYMHLGEYTPAAMAFNRALNMDYDSEVRETAYYNYAITSLNGGKVPFASTVKIFSDFLRLYPQSQYADDVQDYIITSYITDNNYQEALASIQAMASPSKATLAAKQRVLYVLANKALANAEADKALQYLDEATSLNKYNKEIAQEVTLLKGEAYYRMGDYANSLAELRSYIKNAPRTAPNLPLANYDLGYTLYATKDYTSAAKAFEKAISERGSFTAPILADAYNRLADCYYFAKDFKNASDAYDRAYDAYPTAGDYALFQKALMAGYLRDYNKKIFTLQQLQKAFPLSSLIPDVMLETTESYIQLGQTDNAIDVYTSLVAKYPNTAQGRQGYLQMALVKLNSGKHNQAIEDYKTIIKKYPTSDEAMQAVEQMKRISAADGTLPKFIAFLETVDNAPKIDVSEAEQLTFEEAEHEYLEKKSISRLIDFSKTYPQSPQAAHALSYVIEGLNTAGKNEQAYQYASQLVDKYPSSTYVQDALIVKAQIEETQGRGNLALRTWQQLEEVASIPATQLRAHLGVMRNALAGANYPAARDAANAVIATTGIGNDLLAEAYYTLGEAWDKMGVDKKAIDAWKVQADHTDQLYGIMCAYSLGEKALKAKDLTQAESWAKKVANADSPHAYWIARGFILMSDVYTAQGDKYKARQYLEAVRDNYSGDEKDIFDMISKRLK